jgi:serpin B
LTDRTGALSPEGGNLSIHDVLQKAMIAVDETGVEAAAATGVVGIDAAAYSGVVNLVVDHPFVVSIIDVPTGAILFVGHIEDPTAG